MKIIRVKESQIKSITEFLIEKQIIFHPVISPRGHPDFTNYLGRKYILILDRNILTKLIELCTNGSLKDKYLLRLISSLIFWAIFNNINITSGLALMEYAYHKQNDIDASKENNIFLKLFDFYSPELWLGLATGEIQTIPKIVLTEEHKNYVFSFESDHFKMHYTEMLDIMYLYLQNELSPEEKVLDFLRWNNENLLFCCYTLVFALLLFSNKLKQFSVKKIHNIETIFNKCYNQAWDLTYLSVWSTLYWNEKSRDTIYLFATMDKDLKKVFINVHDVSSNIFVRCFGKIKGDIIRKECDRIISNRIKSEVNIDILNNLIESEKEKLKKLLERR